MVQTSDRAGTYVPQPAGFSAFVPRPLPPDPPIDFDAELINVLASAQGALERLDGMAETLPNPDLFVAFYVRKEAVLSSQIEGTQSSLEDVLEFEAGVRRAAKPGDVREVINYIRAMHHGLDRLQEIPVSLGLLREIQAILLEDVRGRNRSPGEFRRTQNWIGSGMIAPQEAAFVPPPPNELSPALDNFEKFLHSDTEYPDLIVCGIAHSQFETIHPFLDGNGRLGRLLITFMLCERRVLRRPLLYLSYYLKEHRQDYYDWLMAVRDKGDWEGWLKFFLRGVLKVSEEASATSREILALQEEHRRLVRDHVTGRSRHALLEMLFEQPYVKVNDIEERLGVSYGTANSLVSRFEQAGLLREITGKQRYRVFVYDPYVRLLTAGTRGDAD